MSYNRVNGYAAECERTVFPGEPSAEERKLYDIVMEARALAFEMVKPGTRCSDIDMTTQEFFKGTSKNVKFPLAYHTPPKNQGDFAKKMYEFIVESSKYLS